MDTNEKKSKLTKVRLTTKASFINFGPPKFPNPWTIKDSDDDDINKVETYRKVLEDIRFFYRKDPLTSTTINKLIDIGINDLEFIKGNLSENEFRVFEGVKQEILDFAESMALEFLLSGLVIPEINFSAVDKEKLRSIGVKKYDSLVLPESMWLRDPSSIEIETMLLADKPTYFLTIPQKLVFFILNEGKFPNGEEDKETYTKLIAYYPELVKEIKDGKTRIKLENDLVIRRRPVSDGPYPSPYLLPAIDSLKHKRNLRRMDYSVATKVISAIQQIKVGDKDYPMTESEEDQIRLEAIKSQFLFRNRTTNEVESIFQLFTDHTVSIAWIFPNVDQLLSESKYKDINQEIIFALGFPRTLITGESERTGSADPEYAAMSPVKTMENFRKKILVVIKNIVEDISKKNGFKSTPKVQFSPINLHEFATFITALQMLFNAGGLSRESLAESLGYDFSDEFDKRKEEQELLEESGLPEFGPQPYSRQPDIQSKTSDVNQKEKDTSKDEKTTDKKNKK